MLNLLATLVVSALPAPAVLPACTDPMPPAEVGACDVVAPLDLWYRMSRFADADPSGVAAGPARRLLADWNVNVRSCDAPATPAQLSAPEAPPVALFALPTLLPVHIPSHFDADARDLPARALAPPERPPRA
jgi:hypothetical protein